MPIHTHMLRMLERWFYWPLKCNHPQACPPSHWQWLVQGSSEVNSNSSDTGCVLRATSAPSKCRMFFNETSYLDVRT